MADSYEQVSSLDVSQTAYDRMVYFSLRPELYFDQAADVEATNQAMPGSAVKFTIAADLPINATALSETTDVSAVTFSDTQVTLTLAEYGNAIITTAKLRGTAFVDVDPVVANIIGFNAGVTIDTVARAQLDAGTQVYYASGLTATAVQTAITSRLGVTTAATISSVDIRVARARLRAQNVPTFGGMYVGWIHPDIVADLQGEGSTTNSLGWRAPHVYSEPGEIWNGELGAYEGIRFIETPRAPVFYGAGATAGITAGTYTITTAIVASSGTVGVGTWTSAPPAIGATLSSSGATVTGTVTVTSVSTNPSTSGGTFTCVATGSGAVTTGTVTAATGANVYATLFAGRQALAKAYSYTDGNDAYPKVIPGPVTDHLRRFVPLGWYWLGAYGVFRQASLLRLESYSTLATDLNSNPPTPPINLGESGTTGANDA